MKVKGLTWVLLLLLAGSTLQSPAGESATDRQKIEIDLRPGRIQEPAKS